MRKLKQLQNIKIVLIFAHICQQIFPQKEIK